MSKTGEEARASRPRDGLNLVHSDPARHLPVDGGDQTAAGLAPRGAAPEAGHSRGGAEGRGREGEGDVGRSNSQGRGREGEGDVGRSNSQGRGREGEGDVGRSNSQGRGGAEREVFLVMCENAVFSCFIHDLTICGFMPYILFFSCLIYWYPCPRVSLMPYMLVYKRVTCFHLVSLFQSFLSPLGFPFLLNPSIMNSIRL